MSGMATHHISEHPLATPYADGREQLADELRRLDLLLRCQVERRRGRGAGNPLDHFRGLVVSDEEVADLLAPRGDPTGSAPPSEGTAAGPSPDPAAERLSASLRERRRASRLQRVPLPLDHLARTFRLTPFDELCLVACLAPELDPKYEKIFAYLSAAAPAMASSSSCCALAAPLTPMAPTT